MTEFGRLFPMENFSEQGIALVAQVLAESQITDLLAVVEEAQQSDVAAVRRSRNGQTFGIRNLLQLTPKIAILARSSALMDIVAQVIGRQAFPVRGIFFDKSQEANWKVPWHQDLAIAVFAQPEDAAERYAGFGPWSVKSGVPHVEPPSPYLERRLALRLHLDACGADTGPLRVVPGSHRQGRIGDTQIADVVNATPAIACLAEAGDVLIMSPLVLHASSPASTPSHRRVIHIEYAADPLPEGLSWFEEI